ncbi:MAG TPA: hypothetical protein VFX16_03560 [Pseudonocardiaceae bacterium]|nr:hypothetical protein [Pseudonocardiaceae bacterium]
MAVPKFGLVDRHRPSGRVLPVPELDPQVTELRIHGVGGTTADVLLDDIAPQQVGGDGVAGFYRTADLARPAAKGRGEINRHVEAYSWGGLTSRSSVRVLWLLLLPFMFANLAGWMYRGHVDANGQPHGIRFAAHRIASGVACLALTVNTVLVLVLIAPNLLAYQATRANLAGRWWLWPLSWTWVKGHGERPLVIGFAAVAVLIVLLVALGVRTQSRYESVRPPWRLEANQDPKTKAPWRPRCSAADRGMPHRDFWDAALAVRRMTGAHVGAAVGFLAVTFAITARAAAAGPVHGMAWWWLAMVLGIVVLAVATAVVAGDHWAEHIGPVEWLSWRLPRFVLHAAGPVALVFAAVFAFQQPAMSTAPGSLPGLDSITAATYIAVGATIVAMILVGATGLFVKHDKADGVFGGPAVVMALAVGLLNSMLLGALFVVGHSLGPLHSDATPVKNTVNVPVDIGWAAPGLGLALIAAVVVYAVVQVLRLVFGWGVPAAVETDMTAYRNGLATSWPRGTADASWTVGMVNEQATDGEPAPDEPANQDAWHKKLKRSYWLGHVRGSAGPLLWLITGFQAVFVIVIVTVRPPIPAVGSAANGAVGKFSVLAATVLLLGVMWLIRSGWSSLTERKRIGMLWDVGTFWPRSFHPLAPPSYAERAVPDFQRRIWRLNDHGAPVLVVAHSQGTVLAAAALAQQGCRGKQGRIGLTTFGAPLTRLYGWAFPAYFNAKVLSSIGETVPDSANVVAWRNFYYLTDPIGGEVTSTATDQVLCNIKLLDPAIAWRIYGDPAPAPGGHSGYWTDRRVWAVIDEVGDAL